MVVEEVRHVVNLAAYHDPTVSILCVFLDLRHGQLKTNARNLCQASNIHTNQLQYLLGRNTNQNKPSRKPCCSTSQDLQDARLKAGMILLVVQKQL